MFSYCYFDFIFSIFCQNRLKPKPNVQPQTVVCLAASWDRWQRQRRTCAQQCRLRPRRRRRPQRETHALRPTRFHRRRARRVWSGADCVRAAVSQAIKRRDRRVWRMRSRRTCCSAPPRATRFARSPCPRRRAKAKLVGSRRLSNRVLCEDLSVSCACLISHASMIASCRWRIG